jgi:hypothetical protein
MARERLGVVAAVVAAHTEQPSNATCVGCGTSSLRIASTFLGSA